MTQTTDQMTLDYRRVEAAIHFLESHFREQPDLEMIAASVHLSPYHFQRLFKRWAGVSPTQFLHYLTLAYAKERLSASQSIYDTALETGLSGAGRLHDLFVTFEAITPGEYKNQGQGLSISYGIHPTLFGDALVATTTRGICALRFVADGETESALSELQEEWPGAVFSEEPDVTEPIAEQLFSSQPKINNRPFHLLLKGTNFQVQVWRALLAIPPGALVSYQDVANHIGRPTAYRAVAGAIAHNPIGYLIPCHRVINKNGRFHNYRWGSTRKKVILGWEASHLEPVQKPA